MKYEAFLYAIDETAQHIIELPSEKHPDHPFKIGYFPDAKKVSTFLRSACGWTLPIIFEAGKDTFSFCKNSTYMPPVGWLTARWRVQAARNKFNERIIPSGRTIFFQKVFDIVEETIDYVLAHAGDGKEYRLCWTGGLDEYDGIENLDWEDNDTP